MSEFHFLRPEMLFGLIPLTLVWWFLWQGQSSFRQMKKAIDPHLLEHLIVKQSDNNKILPIHLLAPVWILAVIALAGPTWEKEPAPFSEDNAGLFVILKNTESMNASDVQPSRLTRAKQKIDDLIGLRNSLSTGLIVYSGSAHLVMPLTRDGSIITTMIEDLTPDLMPVDGDVLLDAILLAQQSVERSQVPASILVITDSISTAQIDAIRNNNIKLPLQFLVTHSPAMPIDKGIQQVASLTGSSISILAVDDSDIEQLSAKAVSDIRAITDTSTGNRWRDAGYYLVIVILMLSLLWSRQGWVVR